MRNTNYSVSHEDVFIFDSIMMFPKTHYNWDGALLKGNSHLFHIYLSEEVCWYEFLTKSYNIKLNALQQLIEFILLLNIWIYTYIECSFTHFFKRSTGKLIQYSHILH